MSRRDYQTLIQPANGSMLATVAEAWHRRDLIYYLVHRDLVVRYKQSALGITWVLLQPIAMMLIFTVIFSRIGKINVVGAPYYLQVFAALLVWQLFSVSLSRASTSVVGNATLVTKVYFPRMIIPISASLVQLIDFGIALIFFLVLSGIKGIYPHLPIFALPAYAVLGLLLSIGLSLWLSALHVRFRDISHIIPLALQVWMYLTPIVYPATLVPKNWLPFYSLNPLVAIVEGVQWSLLGTRPPSLEALVFSITSTVAIFCFGVWYFHSAEGRFSDEI